MIDPADAARLEAKLARLEACVLIDHAHTENLIERVYELEQEVEVIAARLAAVERATPLKRPRQPPTTRR